MTPNFRYAVDRRFTPVLLLFGLRARTDGVRIDDEGTFRATFGWLHLETPRSNIDGAHLTKDYRWWTAIGARTSFVDDGLTFGTNRSLGVCIHFKERVPSRLRRSGHSALTVTVVDAEGLVRQLNGD